MTLRFKSQFQEAWDFGQGSFKAVGGNNPVPIYSIRKLARLNLLQPCTTAKTKGYVDGKTKNHFLKQILYLQVLQCASCLHYVTGMLCSLSFYLLGQCRNLMVILVTNNVLHVSGVKRYSERDNTKWY